MASSSGGQFPRQISLAPPSRHAIPMYRAANPIGIPIGQRVIVPRTPTTPMSQMHNPAFASQHSVNNSFNTPYHQAVPVYKFVLKILFLK